MKFLSLVAFVGILLPSYSAAAPALPPALWAMQAAVPPGTTGATNTETVLPPGVPAPASGGAAGGAAGGGLIGGAILQGAPGQPSPADAQGGGPIGTDGRMPGLPPGVPLPPAPNGGAAPGTSGPAQGTVPTPVPEPTQTPNGATNEPEADAEVPCEVRLRMARIDIPTEGGEFVAPAAVRPAGCIPSISLGAEWIVLTDTPAMKFVVEPNTGTTARDAMVVMGQTSFLVRQFPPVQPGFAATPSHMVFGIGKNGKAETKRLTTWTEQPKGSFTAQPGHPWLMITLKQTRNNRQTYTVTVQPNAGLGAGRHDSFIDLIPAGATSPALRVPVVVEVPGAY